jgi:NAD(P)-dependent dehydrogenase (short-subunit alcohol dehydrogenase family)
MASKHGLSVLSDALALELEPFGIRVVSIEPGFFTSNIIAKAQRAGGDDSPYRHLDEAVGRFMDNGVAGGPDPDTVAQTIVDTVERDRVHIVVGDDAHLS